MKHQKVSIYYDHICIQNFILPFMSLLTGPIVENSHILARFKKRKTNKQKNKHPRPNLNRFQHQIWTSVKRWKK